LIIKVGMAETAKSANLSSWWGSPLKQSGCQNSEPAVSGGMKLDFIRRFEIPFSSDWIFFPLFR